ncbi:MAG TPA: flagellar biosynthesis regulator FlaF, partial [Reyranella sp.]|jgi:flagellar protein FlaF
MQQQAATAYQQVGRQTTSPRELEANLLSKSASNLQRLRDDWENMRNRDLVAALLFNRRLWTVFVSSATREDSVMPVDLRENIANLGIFIMKQSISLQAEPAAQKLDVLININRQLAAGLRANAPA